MPTTFSEAKRDLDQIALTIQWAIKNKDESRRILVDSSAKLAEMPSTFGATIADIDAAAAASPNDEVLTFTKSEKDKLVADFQSVQADIDAMVAALDAV